MNARLQAAALSQCRAPLARTVIVDTCWWYAASPDVVLDAWLDPVVARRWLFASASRPLSAAAIDARAGGVLRLVTSSDGATIDGRVDDLVRPLCLRLTLDPGTPRATRVSASLRATAGGTQLRVRHAGVPAHRGAWLEDRWIGMLFGLGEALDCDAHEWACETETFLEAESQ
jgi:uncharacterized protein YndB with AHSA1/START domain